LALLVLYLAFATRRYAGEATLEFDKQNADMLGVNGATAGATDTLDYNITLQTQADILESDTLALQVIKELNLEQTEDYKAKWSLFDLPNKVIAFRGQSAPRANDRAQSVGTQEVPQQSQG
jgi:succinoglycan biosynthesis transport protein ExoP